jgi:predicted chitinase
LPRIEVIHELSEHELTCVCGCRKHAIGDLQAISQKINGGLNGYTDRAANYDRALKTLI